MLQRCCTNERGPTDSAVRAPLFSHHAGKQDPAARHPVIAEKTHPALLSTRLVPPDHISRLPVIPPAANLSQDLTFRNLPSSRPRPPPTTTSTAGPLTCITCCSFSQFDHQRFQYRCESALAMVKIHLSKTSSRHINDCCLVFMKF